MRGGPIGITESMQTAKERMSTPGTPAIQKPSPATTPWPIAVPTMPKTTERVVLTRIDVISLEMPPERRSTSSPMRSANQKPSR